MSAVAAIRDRLLETPWVYRLWQSPFADAKLQPFLRRVAPKPPARVLDVGCGPGTNAAAFAQAEYVGIDINPEYIATASRRFAGRFLVGDVRDPQVLPDERFDCVFANSVMHHLPDAVVDSLFARMAQLTSRGGRTHLLDLVLPSGLSPARMMARMDRGDFPRPAAEWTQRFARHFRIEHHELYPLGLPGLPLWWMIYLVGDPL